MNIEIPGTNLRLISDKLNVIIQRKHTVDPTTGPNWAKREAEGADPTPYEAWRDVNYHSSVEAALAHLVEQKARESTAKTLAELLAEIRQFKRDMSVLITD